MQPHTRSNYRHQDVGTSSYHDIHVNEVSGYGSSSGNVHDRDNYTKNSEANIENLHLEF